MFKDLNDLENFLEDPDVKIHVRGYAKLKQISPATASKILKYYASQNVLQIEEIQNIHFYKLRINQLTKDLKVFNTIQKIRKIIPELNEIFGKPNIILFGSTSKGEDVKESDIDLYVESEISSEILPEKFEKSLNKTLQLFVHRTISDVPNKHLQENIMNGIVLQGQINWK